MSSSEYDSSEEQGENSVSEQRQKEFDKGLTWSRFFDGCIDMIPKSYYINKEAYKSQYQFNKNATSG